MDYTDLYALIDSGPHLCKDEEQNCLIWQNYLRTRREVYERLIPNHAVNNIVSECNWISRSQSSSSRQLNISVKPGDICYLDFGQAYRYETGYQHFGLIVSMHTGKALIVPMTSNPEQYASAYDEKTNPHGKKHLMRLGRIGMMNRNSVMFLNDMKYLNTARIIDVKGHLNTDSDLFQQVKKRLIDMIDSAENDQYPC